MDTKEFHQFLERETEHAREMKTRSGRMPALLKRARKELGLSLRKMASEIGFSPSYLSLVESGKMPPTSLLVASVVYAVERNNEVKGETKK